MGRRNIEKIMNNEETRGDQTKLIKIYSPKLKREIEYCLNPNDLSKEFYECLGCSNADYGG